MFNPFSGLISGSEQSAVIVPWIGVPRSRIAYCRLRQKVTYVTSSKTPPMPLSSHTQSTQLPSQHTITKLQNLVGKTVMQHLLGSLPSAKDKCRWPIKQRFSASKVVKRIETISTVPKLTPVALFTFALFSVSKFTHNIMPSHDIISEFLQKQSVYVFFIVPTMSFSDLHRNHQSLTRFMYSLEHRTFGCYMVFICINNFLW